eukprot:scaffold10220_cov144-Isochrysis_galbana.AAC.10
MSASLSTSLRADYGGESTFFRTLCQPDIRRHLAGGYGQWLARGVRLGRGGRRSAAEPSGG